MSLAMDTYAPAFDDSIISPWIERMNTLGMHCEVHPEFSFRTQEGFLPFKIILERSKHEHLIGRPFVTGFEFYLDDFDLQAAITPAIPKLTFFDKVLGRVSPPSPPKTYLVDPDVDARLAPCKELLTFVFGAADDLELRMATISSAVLAELTGGVSSYPADSIWYPSSYKPEEALKEAEAHEASLSANELKLHDFEDWR